MKKKTIYDVREELIYYIREKVNRSKLPAWLLETLESWSSAVFRGLPKFKYWDEEKNKYEAEASVDTLKELISGYKEFQKFIEWLDKNYY